MTDEAPIRLLRARLTISFVLISVVIYIITAALAIVVTDSSLNASIESNLHRLIAEIQPAVKVEKGHLTLREWNDSAARQNLHILNVVQLFDSNGALREEYGLTGVRKLTQGDCEQIGLRFIHKYRSRYVPVQNVGFLQIQVDEKQTREAFTHFLITMLCLIPVVALTAGIAGAAFCGKAVAPVSQSFSVLRRFVDDAGHELRTPVSIISASLETLETALTGDAENLNIVSKVSRAVARLKNLSANLLTLSRMESPELSLFQSPIDLTNLIQQVCDDFHAQADGKNIALAQKIAPNLTVSGNADALQRMLSNLLENALRYTANGGAVNVSSAVHGSHVLICVTDNGAGIPPDCLEHVFDRFYRVEVARTREQGGTGLGLSIVKAIAEAHGGSVAVKSNLGEGSTFTVMLPKGPQAMKVKPPNHSAVT